MRKLFQSMVLLVALSVSAAATAATPNDFYTGLLRRGAADVEAGRFNDALTPLRLAAFGLVETIDQYETALAYLTIALDRTGDAPRTRDALQRILAAERVQRKFATLPLPPSIRAAFDTVARKVLTSSEVASLSATSVATAPAPSRPAVETPSRPAVAQPRTEQPRIEQPRTAPTQPVPTQPAPKPVVADPKPVAAAPKPATDPKPVAANPKPATTTPAPQQSASTLELKPPPPAPQQQAPRIDVPARLAAAERALGTANLVEARKIYRELLDAPNVDHATLIRIAEGLYRSRDFAGTLVAFQRVGTLRPGEEAYRYYIAVAAYETGQYERAKRELATALPHIEVTTDVQRYRVKIEAAR